MIVKFEGITSTQFEELAKLALKEEFRVPMGWGRQIPQPVIQFMEVKQQDEQPSSCPLLRVTLKIAEEHWVPNKSSSPSFTPDYCYGHERKKIDFAVVMQIHQIVDKFAAIS